MKIVVTGGSGFIGTNYIDYILKEEKAEILNIDKVPPKKKSHRRFWKECDILNDKEMKNIITSFNPDYLIHLAANVRTDLTDINDFNENIQGVENIVEACRHTENLKRVVFASSRLVCQVGYYPKNDTDFKPNTAYGESKVIGEKIVRNADNLPYEWTIVRPISIWGEWNGAPYLNFFKAVIGGWYFHIGDGHYDRSLGYIGNTVRQIHAIIKSGTESVHRKTYYLADPEPTDLYVMAEMIREKAGAKKIRSFPKPLATMIAKIGDILQKAGWRTVPLTTFRLNNITTEYVYDLSSIMNLAKFRPIPLQTGVDNTLHFIENVEKMELN